MPLTYDIKEQGLLLEVHGRGQVDFGQFRSLTEAMDGKLKVGYRMFMDLRSIDELDLSPGDIRKLVALQKKLPEVEQPAKTVSVTRSGHDYALSRMFQLLAMDERLVTTDVDEAWAWLNAPAEAVEAAEAAEPAPALE